MSKIKDQRFLQKYQYKSAEKYSDRIQFHEHFSTNKYGWFLWVFDQLRIPSKCHILELGCGPGNLWKDNLSRLSEDWTMMLSDYSIGMVKQARSNLETHPLNFCFSVIDAQRIPFADKSFDAIIANHMLYHIPERHHALSEIHRVLKANGHFYASTVGQSHLSELSVLLKRFDPNQKFFWGESLSEDVFTLESGFAELSQWFHNVNITRYEDTLIVTETEPLISFIFSSLSEEIEKEKKAQLVEFLEHEFKINRSIHVTRDIGIFEAIR